MKVILSGGAGFVGRNLTRVMLNEGFNPEDITVIDISKRNLDFFEIYQVKRIRADLAEQGDWMNEFTGADYVVNLAAQISSPSYEPFYRNTVLTTRNVLEAAKNANVRRIIHFGSAAVYSVRKDDYAQTKLEGEALVKNSGLEYCILHPSIMYGPTDDKNIGFLIEFAKKLPCFPIPGHGKWPRQPIYIDDVCHLIISMMHKFPANKVYSINGKDVIYFRDMIKIVLNQLDGFRFRVFLQVSLFLKFLMMAYQKLTGEIQFTSDQVDSLTSNEVFPNYPWWDEFEIDITSFEEGVKRMVDSSG